MARARSNGSAGADPSSLPESLDSELKGKIVALRAQVRDSFGTIVMAMMSMPRYRHQSLADLQHLVLEPLIRDRIAMAYPGKTDGAAPPEVAGFAIWASVSEEVDGKLREQLRAGVWPIRLAPDDWTSGDINWLFDVIASDQDTIVRVIANFKQVAKNGPLKLHPLVTRLVDEETLKKMGAEKYRPQGADGV